jgi:hypothetical protein
VTVTGADDFIDDGDVPYQIVLDAAVSDDVNYSGLNPADVDVVNQDDDTAGLVVTPLTSLVILEGGVALFRVELTSQPTDMVTISAAALGKFKKEAVVTPAQLVFTAENWDQPQIVRVKAKPDAKFNEPNQVVRVRIGPTVSNDTLYAGQLAVFNVTIRDIGLRAFKGNFAGSYLTNPFTPISGVGLVKGPLEARVAGLNLTILNPPGGTGTIKITNSVRADITFSITVRGVKINGRGVIKMLPNGKVRANGVWSGGGGGGVWDMART